MKNIFVLLEYYIPGFKSGGPLRTIENTVARLGDRFRFWIFTRDRDATDTAPYPDVRLNTWTPVGKAMVWYASPDQRNVGSIRRRIAESSADLLYINSFFSQLTIKTLLLRRAGLLPPMPVILAPRGQFAPGALGLKAARKRAYLATALPAGLYHDLIWQATAPHELEEIQRVIGPRARVILAPNLSAPTDRASRIAPPPKRPGEMQLVFLSRVAAKKNLHFLLELLPQLAGRLTLTIYGPLREPDYWRRCSELIARMPSHVTVCYGGAVEHERVADTLAGHHFFVLPTLGENFGHAILEALAAGIPLLISDQTPWRDLSERQLGWDLPLEPDSWIQTLDRCVAMDESEYRIWSQAAGRFACNYSSDPQALSANLELFTSAAGAVRPATSGMAT